MLNPKEVLTYEVSDLQINLESILKSITYFLTFVIENVLLPGQAENWIMIQDLNDMGLLDLPIKVKGLIVLNF